MSGIFTPANFPAIGLGAFFFFAILFFFVLRILFNWATSFIDKEKFLIPIQFTKYFVYFLGLLYVGKYLLDWSGLTASLNLDYYANYLLLNIPAWRWYLTGVFICIALLLFKNADGYVKSKSKFVLESAYVKTIYWGSIRKLLLAGLVISFISSFVWLFHGHNDSINSLIGSDIYQSSISSLIIMILYLVGIVFIISQVFKIIGKSTNEVERAEIIRLKKPTILFAIFFGAIWLLPVESIVEKANIPILSTASLYEVKLFWLLIYGVMAYWFATIFNKLTQLTEGRLENWVNQLFNTDAIKSNTSSFHSKIQNIIPQMTHFVIEKKMLILGSLLVTLLIIVVPLYKVLPYAIVLNLFFVLKLLVDAAYEIFIVDIQNAMAKKQNIVLNLISKILPAVRNPIFFLLVFTAAWSILPETKLLPGILAGLVGYLAVVIGFELINWYAQRMTKKYLSDNKEFVSEDADGFPVFTMMAKIILILVAGLGVIASFGYSVDGVITGLGVAGFAIALALQSLLSDVFASMAISIDKPFTIGDKISVDNLTGTVEKIGIKTTKLRTDVGEEVAVPNTKITGFNVHNFTRINMRRMVLNFYINNSTQPDDIDIIPQIMEDTVKKLKDVEFERASISSFEQNSIVFQLVIRSQDITAERLANLKHEIYSGIHHHLHGSGINIFDATSNDQFKIKSNPANPKKNKGLGRMYG